MSEAKNAEAELAKLLHKQDKDLPYYYFEWDELKDRHPSRAEQHLRTARALLKAGYAKRSDVLEEAAKVADAFAARWSRSKTNVGESACSAGNEIAGDIRFLKGHL